MTQSQKHTGPLVGLKVIELAGLGPAPFAAMILGDLGADVIRIDRLSAVENARPEIDIRDAMNRSRRSLGVDLKHPEGVKAVRQLVKSADVFIEGFRPGVCERIGLGPQECIAENPKLIYGRMTGWGQSGPYAHTAGHDINYIALAGALHPLRRAGERPQPPLNMLADFGGGGMLLAVGICAALLHVTRTGVGQVVDAAMVDGSALLMTMIHGFMATDQWVDGADNNKPPSTAPHFYDVYETLDGMYITVGSIEPQFYVELLTLLGLLDDPIFKTQNDPTNWPEQSKKLATIFKHKTSAEWCVLLEGSDACFAPVLSLTQAPFHPHNIQRQTFTEIAGVMHPSPAPRFSETPARISQPPCSAGQHTKQALTDWGFSDADIDELFKVGAIAVQDV